MIVKNFVVQIKWILPSSKNAKNVEGAINRPYHIPPLPENIKNLDPKISTIRVMKAVASISIEIQLVQK